MHHLPLRSCRFIPFVVTLILISANRPCAADQTPLIDPANPKGGWSFDNGKEFPGAVGRLELVTEDG